MLHSLQRLWQNFLAWVTQSPVLEQHLPPAKPYYPSNLHSRHR